MLEIAIGAIIVALIFDFVNGFNDSANSVATVIGTRVLKPLQAVSLSAAMNFIGPFIFGVAVATTIALDPPSSQRKRSFDLERRRIDLIRR